MDKLKKYKKAIKSFLEEQGNLEISNMPKVNSRVIIDEKKHQYLLIWTGWNGAKYIHRIWYHIEIAKEKIVVLENKTDINISEELEYLGVNKKDITAIWAPQYLKDAA